MPCKTRRRLLPAEITTESSPCTFRVVISMGWGVALRINYLQLGSSPIFFSLSRDYSGSSVVSGRDAWPVIRSFIHAALQDSEAGILVHLRFSNKKNWVVGFHSPK